MIAYHYLKEENISQPCKNKEEKEWTRWKQGEPDRLPIKPVQGKRKCWNY